MKSVTVDLLATTHIKYRVFINAIVLELNFVNF